MPTRYNKITDDAFGQEMIDYFNGEEISEIIERDDGYIDTAATGPISYFSEYKDWHPMEKKALVFAQGKILDVGCGVGRHSLFFQKKRFDVTSIDNSPGAIQVCKKRGVKNARVLSFENVGILKPGTFDTVLMLGHNFGLFGSKTKVRRMLKVLSTITTSEAVIIATTMDPSRTDNPMHKRYHSHNRKRGRLPGQVRIRVRHQDIIGPWFDYLFVSQSELIQILKGTGWEIKKVMQQKNESSYAVVLSKI